jgi:hypothetical protein
MGAAGVSGGGNGGAGAGSGGSGGLNCTAPTVDCAGTCVDVTNSATNCGACGYACGAGSTCAQGACAPVAIVSGVVAPYSFALDATNLYFASPVRDLANALPSAVRKAPRAGGGAVTSVFGTGFNFRSRSLALTGGTLFLGDLDNNGVIRQGATTGGDVTTRLTEQPAVQQIIAADERLWWSTTSGDTSRLRRVSTTDTTSLAEELLPGPAFVHFDRVPMLAVEGTGAAATVFWVNAGGSVNTDKGLWRKVGGAAPAKLVAEGEMVTLALGSGEVFVADAVAGIGKIAGDAIAPTTLTPVVVATELGGALQGLAVAGETLYWLTFNAGQLEVHRAGLDGGNARVLGRVVVKSVAYWSQPIGPTQLVVDGGFVYFSDPGTLTGDTQAVPNLQGVTGTADGAIYRLPE